MGSPLAGNALNKHRESGTREFRIWNSKQNDKIQLTSHNFMTYSGGSLISEYFEVKHCRGTGSQQ